MKCILLYHSSQETIRFAGHSLPRSHLIFLITIILRKNHGRWLSAGFHSFKYSYSVWNALFIVIWSFLYLVSLWIINNRTLDDPSKSQDQGSLSDRACSFATEHSRTCRDSSLMRFTWHDCISVMRANASCYCRNDAVYTGVKLTQGNAGSTEDRLQRALTK